MNQEIDTAGQALASFVNSIGAALPSIVAGLAVFAGFLVAAAVARRLLQRVWGRVKPERRPLVELASETARYGLIVVGLITGLGTMGIDVSALIAGLGLTGFALGFALRDAVSNLIAAVMILVYQPFRTGDTITVGGETGTVTAINLRYTVLLAEGGVVVHVPTSNMFNNSVKVAPRAAERRPEPAKARG
jgi:small-conductance mechanosensitive channel